MTPRRTGLTLVELLAAIVITAMLLTAALAAVRNLARSERIARAAERPSLGTAGLGRLLATDLLHCRKVRKLGKRLELQTRSSLRGEDMELEHLRCTVRYEVRQVDSRPWLIRVQQTQARQPLRELVLPDVAAIDLRDADEQAKGSGGKAGKGRPRLPAAAWSEPPRHALVTVTMAGEKPRSHAVTVRRN